MAHPTDANTAIYQGAPRVGLRNVGSYQISGEPWITGSTAHPASKTKRYQFPYVTREITVSNLTKTGEEGNAGTTSSPLRVHFVSSSLQDWSAANEYVAIGADTAAVFKGKHYYPVRTTTSVTFRAKCKEIYITTTASGSATYRIIADLTNIPTSRMYHLTGSGHTEV